MKTKLLLTLQVLLCLKGFPQSSKIIIDTKTLKSSLLGVGKETNIYTAKSQALNQGITINLPSPENNIFTLKPIESPLMHGELAKKFSEIKTYRIFDVESNSAISGILTLSPAGINALIFTDKGSIQITPLNISEDEYEVKYQSDTLLTEQCELTDEHIIKSGANNKVRATQDFSNGGTLRSYRMAICTTGEFFTNNGGTQVSAQAAIVSMVNSLRAVYEKEMSVTFTLVSTKIYDNSASDPFNPSSGSKALDAAVNFGALASSDPANFALTVYDIGHVIHHSPGGGGVAYLSAVCRNTNLTSSTSPVKGGAWSGGTTTSLATFIHEVGHQFSANHTFNSTNSGCSGNINVGTSYEPGSGSTYMSYWGSCSPDNISGSVNRTYFHANSLESIYNYITSSNGSCSTNSASGNSAPVLNTNPLSKTYTVPKGTPFVLTGSGSDANGNPILFNWEQYDQGTTRGGADDAKESTNSPIFRSFTPSTTGNIRTFPALGTILNGNIANNDEALSTVARTIKMRLTARDNIAAGGGTISQQVNVTVDNSGPFLLTSQNTPVYWIQGSSKTITWSVNGTNTAPLNCSTVDILFSTDNGITFPTTLVANTPNDGSHIITVPNNVTAAGRIKIIPNNTSLIFFDINNSPITVTNTLPTCLAETSNILPIGTISALAGDPSLSLDGFGYKTIISTSKSTSTTDPTMPQIGYNASGCSTSSTASMYYKTLKFRVSDSGIYNFTISTPLNSKNINIFSGSFQGNCTNWIAGNLNMTSSTTATNPLITNLLANTDYEMTIASSLNATSTGTVVINFSGAGNVLEKLPKNETFYSYAYLIHNTSTGLITSIQPNTDLSNAFLFPAAQYIVYGVSFLTENLNFATFQNQSFTSFQAGIFNSTICAKLSSNSMIVNSQGNCDNTITLTGTAITGLQSVNQTIESTQIINPGTNTQYKAGNSIMLSPLVSSGFEAKSGSVFLAEIGGCN